MNYVFFLLLKAVSSLKVVTFHVSLSLVDSCHMTILYIIVVFLIRNKHSAVLDFTKNNLKQYNQANLTCLRTTFPGELLVIFKNL